MATLPSGPFLNIRGHLLDLAIPRVMGIINLTADSFYDGGKIKSDSDLLNKVEKMCEEGVDILDVGAYSSRPGAKDIPVEAEQNAATYGVQTILKEFPEVTLSVDTFRSTVAQSALNEGAHIVNDISGGQLDNYMFDLIEQVNVPYIMMHMRGDPQTMGGLTDYNHLVHDVMDYFVSRIRELTDRGVSDVVADVGFGFAKTRQQNFELLNELELFDMLDVPILCGVSRKSMIFKTLEVTPDEALNGTTALNMACLMKGANILRVHDVKEAKETIKLYQSMRNRL